MVLAGDRQERKTMGILSIKNHWVFGVFFLHLFVSEVQKMLELTTCFFLYHRHEN